MRICFLMPSHWSGNLGGAEIQVRYLMEYLRANTQHELAFVCRHSRMTSEFGVEIHRTVPLRPWGRWFKSADLLSVRDWLSRLRPDVIYTRVGSPYVGFAARHCRRVGGRLVHHIARLDDVTPAPPARRGQWARRLERPLYEYGLRRANAIIAQAAYQGELLAKHYGLRPTAVIPNFHPSPTEASKPPGQIQVLWVANLKPDKRPELFVEIARRCVDLTQVQFVMIGAIQGEGYRPLIADAGSLPNLLFLGARGLDDVNDLLQQSHLFVNTSRHAGEGFPNTFIQAWLRGTPVASLEVDPDGLLSGGDFGVCAAGDIGRFLIQVRSLLGHPEEIAALGQNAREHARQTYGMANCRRVVEILEAAPETSARNVA